MLNTMQTEASRCRIHPKETQGLSAETISAKLPIEKSNHDNRNMEADFIVGKRPGQLNTGNE